MFVLYIVARKIKKIFTYKHGKKKANQDCTTLQLLHIELCMIPSKVCLANKK